MFRREQKRKMEMDQFFTRVTSYPVVTSAISQVSGIYERTKESNRLVKYTCETAESGLKTVSDKALPVVNTWEKPISNLNSIACSQLDKLEEKYPIIKKPTEEVVEESKQLYNSTLKPTVDRVTGVTRYGVETVSSVKNYSVDKVNSVTQYGTDTVCSVKDYSMQKVNSIKDYSVEKATSVKDYSLEKATVALNSPYGQVLTSKLDTALDLADTYVDKFLPEAESEKSEEHEKDAATEKPVTLNRVMILGDKVKRRMYTRAMNDLQNVQKRSKEALDKLNFTVDLIQYARTNIDSANKRVRDGVSTAQQKLWDTWEEISREETEEDKKSLETKTFEKQAVHVARRLIVTFRHGLNTTMESAHNLPEIARSRLDQAKRYSEDLYESFRKVSKIDDLSNMVLEQSKDKVTYMQETMAFLTDVAVNSWALSWLGNAHNDSEMTQSESKTNDGSGAKNGESSGAKDGECSLTDSDVSGDEMQ